MEHEEHHSPYRFYPRPWYMNTFYSRFLPHPGPMHDEYHERRYGNGMSASDKKTLVTIGLGAVGAIAIVAVAVALMRKKKGGIPV